MFPNLERRISDCKCRNNNENRLIIRGYKYISSKSQHLTVYQLNIVYNKGIYRGIFYVLQGTITINEKTFN